VIRPRPDQLVRAAALLALLALACMVWSLLDPRPVPIMVAMSVGQALGTLSFLLYASVVVVDGYRSTRAARAAEPAAPTAVTPDEVVDAPRPGPSA
jgi:hypothetical protein